MPRILIVDDSESTRNMISELLIRNGYQVISAVDGEQGLIKAVKQLPDLIILDIEMPKMRGWEVCKILKHRSQTALIPILVLTSRSELSDIVVAMQQGADDYLRKPFVDEDLLNRIDRLLRTR